MLRPAPDEGEADLILRWQEHRRTDDLQKLIALYMTRIKSWARKGGRENQDDLVAEGVFALLSAADRVTLPFAGVLAPSIRGAIYRASAVASAQISIPERQIRDAISGRMTPVRAELLKQALKTVDFDEFSIEMNGPTAEEETLSKEKQRGLRQALALALRPLARQERQLVVKHLLHGDAGLEELAGRMQLSTERARNLEGRALHKMRNVLIKNGFALQDLA